MQPPSGLLEALRLRFDEAQLVELAAAIAWENYRARFNRVFGVRPVGFCKEGTICALPERWPAKDEPLVSSPSEIGRHLPET